MPWLKTVIRRLSRWRYIHEEETLRTSWTGSCSTHWCQLYALSFMIELMFKLGTVREDLLGRQMLSSESKDEAASAPTRSTGSVMNKYRMLRLHPHWMYTRRINSYRHDENNQKDGRRFLAVELWSSELYLECTLASSSSPSSLVSTSFALIVFSSSSQIVTTHHVHLRCCLIMRRCLPRFLRHCTLQKLHRLCRKVLPKPPLATTITGPQCHVVQAQDTR